MLQQFHRCVSDEKCPMPVWEGATSSLVKDNYDQWSLLKVKIKQVLENKKKGLYKGWTKKFWKTADWTVVFACPFSVAGQNNTGSISMVEAKGMSNSKNGKLWAFGNRQGAHLTMGRGNNFRVAIDHPDGTGPVDWTKGVFKKGGYTCEIGVLPGHWPHLASCLEHEYGDDLSLFFKTSKIPA